jgi:WD40 repeat protein
MPFGRPTPGQAIVRLGVARPKRVFGVFSYYRLVMLFLDMVCLTMASPTERINIFAAAGLQGDIKLVRSDELICYAQMKGHKNRVNCLLFHSSNPSLLFSGAGDRSVMLWDIGIPCSPDYKKKHKALIRFTVPVPELYELPGKFNDQGTLNG